MSRHNSYGDSGPIAGPLLILMTLPAFLMVGLLCNALAGLPVHAAETPAASMPSPFPKIDPRDRAIGSNSNLDGEDLAMLPPSYPTKEFAAQDSSPVLLITNLKQYEPVVHITADVIQQDSSSSSSQGGNVGGSGQSYQKVPVFDLGVPAMTGLKLPEGMHAYGIPDFRMNHTAALEFKFWTPCDQEPEGMFDLTVMPCFYSPFEGTEGKIEYPYFSHGQRGTMYMPYHIPEDLKHPSYAAYLEAQAKREAGNCTEDGECDVPEPPPIRINTKVDCWFPPHRSVEALATPINLIGHDHRVGVREIVYQRVPATSPPSGESEVYYDTRIKEFPAKRLDPLPEAAKEAAKGPVPEIVDGAVVIDGVRYCRSTLQVFASDASDDAKLSSEPVGWTIASPTSSSAASSKNTHHHHRRQ